MSGHDDPPPSRVSTLEEFERELEIPAFLRRATVQEGIQTSGARSVQGGAGGTVITDLAASPLLAGGPVVTANQLGAGTVSTGRINTPPIVEQATMLLRQKGARLQQMFFTGESGRYVWRDVPVVAEDALDDIG